MSTEAAAQKRPVELEASWLKLLREEFDSDYMRQLRVFLREEKQSGRQVFPPGSDMFNALNSTPFDDVKIVILGQDPYHGEGQAHGLCFSVKPGVPVPPSLRNIYRELETDMGFDPPGHGFLQAWAQQGVLLLNSVLTVRANQAG
ncbi:MAG: uracil-DNA glycosylase, partial [Pseudohongiellaceae bacterium]